MGEKGRDTIYERLNANNTDIRIVFGLSRKVFTATKTNFQPDLIGGLSELTLYINLLTLFR